MAEPELIPVPDEPTIPDVIVIAGASDVRMTPNEMRRLKTETGRTMTELMGDTADDADRMQALIWLRLRRDGHDVSWDDCGDVAIEYEEEPADPTSGEPSKTSPDSADSGG